MTIELLEVALDKPIYNTAILAARFYYRSFLMFFCIARNHAIGRGATVSSLRWGRHLIILNVAALLAGCQVTEGQLEAWVRSRDFTVLNPPSNGYGPGSLVYRKNYDPKEEKPSKVALGYLCDPRYSTDLYALKPIASETLGQVSVTEFGGSMSAGIPALAKVANLDARLKAGSTITANISDARIVQFGKDNLWEIRNSLQRACRSIVNGNVATKNAYQVVQALQATIDINVKMNASLDATAAAKLLKNLADLGFTATGDQNVTLKGAALFVGVELEPISSPVADPAEPVASSQPQSKPDRI